jgi:hypothetical protein
MSDPPATPDTPIQVKRRRRRWRVAAIVFAVVALLLVGLYRVDRWMRPGGARSVELTVGSDAAAAASRPDSITAPLDQPPPPGTHPLAPALAVAEAGLAYFQDNVRDYTAVFIKQERVDGVLAEEQQAFLKIRQPQGEGDARVPFAAYMRFLQPPSVAGREVIYVAGENDGRLVAHEGGLLGLATVWLEPTSPLAMRGNRYPITEIGIETMIRRMIEKGQRDAAFEDCVVRVDRTLTVEGHRATQIEIVHEQRQPSFDFHIARILIDDVLNVPVSYESLADGTRRSSGAPGTLPIRRASVERRTHAHGLRPV